MVLEETRSPGPSVIGLRIEEGSQKASAASGFSESKRGSVFWKEDEGETGSEERTIGILTEVESLRLLVRLIESLLCEEVEAIEESAEEGSRIESMF